MFCCMKRGKIYTMSDSKFRELVANSATTTDVLRACGLQPIGGNNKLALRRITDLGIDTSHFLSARNRIRYEDINEVLVPNSPISNSNWLKKRLIQEGLLENRCVICGQEPEWNGKPLVMHLDHINGVHTDNRLSNLRIICPHCDSQLPTYKGRNKKAKERFYGTCEGCGKPVGESSTRCRSCARKGQGTKIKWPSMEELAQLVEQKGYCAVARELGVSDNAVRKHIKNYQ